MSAEGQGRELAAVARLSEALFRSDDLDALVEAALATAVAEVGAESGSVLLADPEAETLVFHHSLGEHPVPRGTRIPWDRGVAGAVFASGVGRIVADVQQSPDHFAQVDRELGHVTRDLVSVPLRSWGGDPIGVMNLLNKRAGRFVESDRELLTLLAALTAVAIAQARRFEEAKLAEVARRLGDVGHDLKNMFTPVLSSAGLLREELGEIFAGPLGSDPRYALSRELTTSAVELIVKSSARIQHRVKEISDCVKGRSSAPRFAACRLGPLADDLVSTLGPMAAEQQVELSAAGFAELPEIEADEHRLYGALYNLIINAIPETPPGGHVRLEGRAIPDGVVIEVRDDGRGMPAELVAQLFSSGLRSDKRGGAGLGTRIVKDVIDAHRGSIEVHSEPGRGTTFRLRLPSRNPP